MKKVILLLMMLVAMTTTVMSERKSPNLSAHEVGSYEDDSVIERTPIYLPIKVFYETDTKVIEVLCDNDNICGEVYIYDQSGELEAYSPYMNISIQLYSSGSHTIIIKGDGWVAEGVF